MEEKGFPTFSATMEMFFHSGIMKATVMHELLHTCAGCDNHNGMCRGYAALADFCISL